MLDINARQKDNSNIQYWKAFTVQYTIAKRFRIPRILFTYFLVLAAPFIILYNNDFKPIFAIIGALWTILALIISYIEKDTIKEAAKIQDEFDIRVFNLKWNKVLLGDHISYEVIHSLSSKFNGPVDERWYGDLSNIVYPFNVIVSQRSNIVWDWRLRRNYYFLSLILLMLIALGGIFLSILNSLSLESYITTIFFPSSAAYILGFKELKEHFDNFSSKRTMEKRLNSIINSGINEEILIDTHLLRQVQDVIYTLRKCTAIVPNWFYKLFQKKYERRMQSIINEFS